MLVRRCTALTGDASIRSRKISLSLVSTAVSVLMVWLASAAISRAEVHQVRIEDHEFVPRSIVVAPGDTVVWTNFGSDHTVTADDNSFSSTTTGGAAMGLGETFTQTFPAVGRYPYYCQLHGGPGGQDMAGVVRVLIPGENQLPSTPVN